MEDVKVFDEELQHYDDDHDLDYLDYDDEEDEDDFDEDDLQHWGIKGMKWGVRRFQNSDGSLTPAGEKRYGSLTDAVGAVKAARIKAKRKKNLKKAREAAAEKRKVDAEQKAAAEQRKKDVAEGKVSARKMTAEELQSRIDKLNLEKRYKQLMEETNPNTQTISAGKNLVNKFLHEAIIPAAVSATKSALTEQLTAQAKKRLGLTDDTVDALEKTYKTLDLKSKISTAEKTIWENKKKMSGEESESERLKKEADDWENRGKIAKNQKSVYENNKQLEQQRINDNYERSKQEYDKQNSVSSSKYRMKGKDIVDNKQYVDSDSTNPARFSNVTNPPAVVEKAVTSLSKVGMNSKETSDYAEKGKQTFDEYIEIIDKNGETIRIRHSDLSEDELRELNII